MAEDVRRAIARVRETGERLVRRDLDEQHQRAEQLERLADTLVRVGVADDVAGALEALLRGAVGLLGAEHGLARLLDPGTGERTLELTLSSDGQLSAATRPAPLAPGSYGARLIAGEPAAIIDDYERADPAQTGPEHSPLRDDVPRAGMRSAVHVAIDARGARIGNLSLHHSRPGFFEPQDLAMAQGLASKAGAVIARVQRETALREARALHRLLLEAIRSPVLAVDSAMTIKFCNRAYDAFVGASVEALEGADLLERSPSFATTQSSAASRRALETAAPQEAAGTMGERSLRVRVYPIPALTESLVESAAAADTVPAGVLAIAEDETDRKAVADVDHERARLDGALLVARTVAHEINNAISPIVGFAELAASRPSVAADPETRLYLQLIGEAAAQVALKVRRLQQIVRLETTAVTGTNVTLLDLDRSAAPAGTQEGARETRRWRRNRPRA